MMFIQIIFLRFEFKHSPLSNSNFCLSTKDTLFLKGTRTTDTLVASVEFQSRQKAGRARFLMKN